MKPIKAKISRALPVGSEIGTCDNSGAKVLKIVNVVGQKTVKGRPAAAGIADLVLASVRRGRPDMRKQVVYAVIVRQKKAFRRLDGMRVSFEDNAAAVLKDEKGTPKGTIFKGPVAKEACERWTGIAKVAKVIL